MVERAGLRLLNSAEFVNVPVLTTVMTIMVDIKNAN